MLHSSVARLEIKREHCGTTKLSIQLKQHEHSQRLCKQIGNEGNPFVQTKFITM